MSIDFSSVHNYHERQVFAAVLDAVPRHAGLDADQLADVACVALNRLPPRYIRHDVDFAFYQGEKERAANERALRDAVDYAFRFVLARVAMSAR